MGSSQERVSTSVSLEKDVADAAKDADEINRSSLANSLMKSWLEDHGYL